MAKRNLTLSVDATPGREMKPGRGWILLNPKKTTYFRATMVKTFRVSDDKWVATCHLHKPLPLRKPKKAAPQMHVRG